MSVQPSNPAPEAPAAEAPKPTAPPAPEPAAAAPEVAPPWGDPANFDPEKAWKLLQNKQADIEKLKARPVLTDEQKSRLAEFERLSEASKSELEKAQDAAKKSAERAEAFLTSAVKAKIEALATGFADPSDAVSALDAKTFATESGEIDSDGIKAALADILARKPHWAKSPESRVPAPNPAQGSSGSGASGGGQLTEAEVKDMYARKDYDGIAKAQAEGRLSNLLG